MRIISGNFKGKKILIPKDRQTRPLKDLTKESIFNIILHSNKIDVQIKGSNILDLFSGVGSFGLEAFSRGAKNITFVENYSGVITILKKNIKSLNLNKNIKIIEKDIINNLDFKIFNTEFDIIFIDPPYKEENIQLVLFKILNSKILKNKGIIILHRHKNNNDIFPDEFNIIEIRTYGISKIIFLKFN